MQPVSSMDLDRYDTTDLTIELEYLDRAGFYFQRQIISEYLRALQVLARSRTPCGSRLG